MWLETGVAGGVRGCGLEYSFEGGVSECGFSCTLSVEFGGDVWYLAMRGGLGGVA